MQRRLERRRLAAELVREARPLKERRLGHPVPAQGRRFAATPVPMEHAHRISEE
jgi:hypothetical protein